MSMYIICQNAFKDGCDPWLLSKFMAKPMTNKGPEYIEPDDYIKADNVCWSCDYFTPKPGQYNFSCNSNPSIIDFGVHIGSKDDYKSYVKEFAKKHCIDQNHIVADYNHDIIDEP